MISRPPIVGVPHLTMWLCGPSSRICLPKPEEPQQPDVRRHEDHDQGEREQQALDELERSSAAARARPAPPSAATQRRRRRSSSSTPRDALTRTTSPGRSASREHVERGRGVGDASTIASGGEARGAARRPRSRAAPVADDDEPVDGPAGRLADLAMARVVRVAQLEHLAQDRDVAAGQAGEQLQRRAHGAAATRCSCRRGCATPPARISSTAVRRATAGRRARGTIVVQASPAASPTAAAASALWTACRPSAGIATVARPAGMRAGSASRRARAIDVRRADVGVLGEAVGRSPRPRVASAIRARRARRRR